MERELKQSWGGEYFPELRKERDMERARPLEFVGQSTGEETLNRKGSVKLSLGVPTSHES